MEVWDIQRAGADAALSRSDGVAERNCDLTAAYKNGPLPLAIHDDLWMIIEDMKLKAELAIDPSYATGARVLDALIQERRAASDRGGADTSQATLALFDRPEL